MRRNLTGPKTLTAVELALLASRTLEQVQHDVSALANRYAADVVAVDDGGCARLGGSRALPQRWRWARRAADA